MLKTLFSRRISTCSSQVISKGSRVPASSNKTPSRFFSAKKSNMVAMVNPNPQTTIALENFLNVLNNGLAKPQAKLDKTALVHLESPPECIEAKEVADYLGVNQVYRSGYKSGNSYYFYMVRFEPDKLSSLEDYTKTTSMEFFSKIPYGYVHPVSVPANFLANLEHLLSTNDIQCKALFFDKKLNVEDLSRYAELLFIIKTPGGFWNISCHSSYYYLTTHKEILFANLLQNLKVELRKTLDEPPVLPMLRPSDKRAVSTTDRPKKRASKLTQKATIGSWNLAEVQPEDISLDEEDLD